MEVLQPEYKLYRKNEIAFSDMEPIVSAYATERIGNAMNKTRLKYIFNFPYLNKIAVFSIADKTLGYVWLIEDETIRHYWFSFFDTSFFSHGIGKWMMEQMISDAKKQGKKHIYLGTCYGEKALYKIRDFKAVEYFDGNSWRNDTAHLKSKCKNEQRNGRDDFKNFPGRF
jgi:GNAT superfamily N-acetyltransferase